MGFVVVAKWVSVEGGGEPARVGRGLGGHRRWTFACALGGVMTLLPGATAAYQAGPEFAQANLDRESLLNGGSYLMPSPDVGTEAARGASEDGLPDAPLPATEPSIGDNVAVAEA